jgi:hypothetical protein
MKRPAARPEARPGSPATSTPPTLHGPNAGSTPQPKAPPDQGASLDQGASPDQGPRLDQEPIRSLKTPPVEARPAASPSTQKSKRPPDRTLSEAQRASKTERAALSAPMPRAVIVPPQQPLGRTPAPVRNPAPSSSASANVVPPGRAVSSDISGAGVPSNAGTHPNAPAASALAPPATDHGLTAKGTRPGSVAKVASVGLPAMEKGLMPKRPVAPAGVKIEIIPRPAVKRENCGDDKVFVACPTLKIRYDTPFTSEAP